MITMDPYLIVLMEEANRLAARSMLNAQEATEIAHEANNLAWTARLLSPAGRNGAMRFISNPNTLVQMGVLEEKEEA
jgi:hypothetical protein